MPLENRPNSNCRLYDLAELMQESSWQRIELARIKTKLGYRVCSSIYAALDRLFCSNLFSYVDDKAQQSQRDRADASSSKQRAALPTLEQMNAQMFGRARKCTRIILLTRLLLIYCCCCCAGLLMSAFFQYKHDYYSYHLRRFQAAQMSSRASIYAELNVTEAQLAQRLQDAKAATKIFGSFLLRRPYFAQSCYILMTMLCIFTYPGPLIFFHLKGHFDFHYLRMLLDWDQEQRNCNRMLVDLIEKLCRSSERFMQISLEEHQARVLGFSFKKLNSPTVTLYNVGQEEERRVPVDARASYPRPKAAALALSQNQLDFASAQRLYAHEHEWLKQNLTLSALTGKLQPLDRCDAREMSKSSAFYAVFVILTIESCLTWNVILFTSLPLYFGFVYELDLMSCLSFVELASLNIMLTFGGTFYLSLALIYCREQVRVAKKLRSMICRFVAKYRCFLRAAGGEQAARHISNPAGPEECAGQHHYYDMLNTDLLLILMHYKTFAHQSRPAERTFGSVLLCCIGLMTIFPLITRLHLPYLQDVESRALSIIVCFIMVGLPDMSMVPMCWMHSRCSQLGQDLWKLMAAIVEIAEHPHLAALLNEHSVWLLRKELSHPELQHARFAIVALGLKFTYAELLKLHFWLGFIILSFIIEFKSAPADATALYSQSRAASSDSVMFGSWFSDPLGIVSSFSL